MLTYHITDPLSHLLKFIRKKSDKTYVSFKVVVRCEDGDWHRGIFISSKTQRQVAVATNLWKGGKVKLSIPIEGMGGWHVMVPFRLAMKVASRETTRRGKVFNRLVFLPISFILYDCH